MEIYNAHFEELSCEPLEKLEITPELFRIHIKFTHEDIIYTRLLSVKKEDMQGIELNLLDTSGFISIIPKSKFYDQLSIDPQFFSAISLNQGNLESFKRKIIIHFEANSSDSIFCQIEEWYSNNIPVKIEEKNKYKLLDHDDGEYYSSIQDGSSFRRNETDSLIILCSNSPSVSESITESSGSPLQGKSSILPENDHFYAPKGGSSHTGPVTKEFYQLLESEVDKLLTFPGAGYPRRIVISKDTLRCLQPGIYLNNTIIEFYLNLYPPPTRTKAKRAGALFQHILLHKIDKKFERPPHS